MKLDKDFNTFVANRCEEALTESAEYKQIAYDEYGDQDRLLVLTEELCYKKGFLDAMAIIKGV